MTCVLDSVSDACVSWYPQTVTRYRIRSRSDTCRCPHYMVAFCHCRCCADSRTWRNFNERNRDHCHSSRRSSWTPADEMHTTRQSQNWTVWTVISVSSCGQQSLEIWVKSLKGWLILRSIIDTRQKVFQDLVFKKWGQRTAGEDLVKEYLTEHVHADRSIVGDLSGHFDFGRGETDVVHRTKDVTKSSM